MEQPRETKQFSESENTSNLQTQHQRETERRQHIKRSGKYVPQSDSYRFSSFVNLLTPVIEWAKKYSIQPIFNQLSQANFFQFLATASVIMAIFILLTEADERKEKAIYEAWNISNSAKNEQSGVLILALERLNKEKYSLSGIDAPNTDLRRINLTGANLRTVNFRGANLKEANLRGANLLRADLNKIKLRSSDLEGVLLMEANLEEANLTLTNLKGADLWAANLVKADLTGANLTGADLTGANLTNAKLEGANLTNAQLKDANLTGADLTGANLTNAQLKGANLESANLEASNLTKIQELSQLASFNSKTIFPKNFRPEETGMVKRKSVGQQDIVTSSAVWWGFITSPQRKKTELRYEVSIKDGFLNIVLAPYGQTPLQLENIEFNGIELFFSWPRAKPLQCELRRQLHRGYVGQCRDAQNQTLDIRMNPSFREKPLRGRDLAPSEIDLQILQQALEILYDESVWHQADERVCDDDEKQDSWSIFCALYRASLEVTSKYLHSRPAMKEARNVIREITNKRPFEHRLRDYNNLPETTFEDIQNVLELAIERLEEKVR